MNHPRKALLAAGRHDRRGGVAAQPVGRRSGHPRRLACRRPDDSRDSPRRHRHPEDVEPRQRGRHQRTGRRRPGAPVPVLRRLGGPGHRPEDGLRVVRLHERPAGRQGQDRLHRGRRRRVHVEGRLHDELVELRVRRRRLGQRDVEDRPEDHLRRPGHRPSHRSGPEEAVGQQLHGRGAWFPTARTVSGSRSSSTASRSPRTTTSAVAAAPSPPRRQATAPSHRAEELHADLRQPEALGRSRPNELIPTAGSGSIYRPSPAW